MASGGFATAWARNELGRVSSWGEFSGRVSVAGSSVTGNTYYADSGSGNTANSGNTPSDSKATIAQAYALCTANNGDRVLIAEGHAETISSATVLAMNKAGVMVIGCGVGSDRPTLTFSTATTANIPISAVNNVLKNVLLVSALDSVVAAVTISAADCAIEDVEIRDTTDIEFVTPILTTAAADRLTLRRVFHNGFVTGDACTEAFSLIGVDVGLIEDCRFLGNYSTACINLLTTASTKLVVRGCVFLETAATVETKALVDTQGSSTYAMFNCYDQATGRMIAGNNTVGLSASDGVWFYKSKADPSPLGSQTLFTYTGHIEFKIWCVITTAIQAQATTIKWTVTPDSLAAADLCGTKDINAMVAGTLVSAVGTTGTAAVATDGVGSVGPFGTNLLATTCITSGIISVAMGAASTGAITHYIAWRPLTPSATVV